MASRLGPALVGTPKGTINLRCLVFAETRKFSQEAHQSIHLLAEALVEQFIVQMEMDDVHVREVHTCDV